MTAAKSETKRNSVERVQPVFAARAKTRKVDTRAISKSVMERTKKARAYLAK
jgi:hypothetical protein